MSLSWPRVCAEQHALTFTRIFNHSWELCEVPSGFKSSTITPVPKTNSMTGLNDYRPVTLTSIVVIFERLVLVYLKGITRPCLTPCWIAYETIRSVDDAVSIGMHYILCSLDTPGTYARILFLPLPVSGSPASCLTEVAEESHMAPRQ